MKRLFVSLFLILGWANVHALTLTELRIQIRRNVGDTPATQDLRKYGDTALTAYLNEAQRVVVNLTWPMEDRQIFALTSQTTFYSLPTNYLATKDVLYKRSGQPNVELKAKAEHSLIDENANWQLTAGTPANYLIVQSTTVNVYQMAIYPVPTSTSTGTVTHIFTKYPADLSSGADKPFDRKDFYTPYHDLLAHYVTSKLMAAEGRAVESQIYLQLFSDGVNAMKSRIGQPANYKPGSAAGGSTP
jgi:hypothetical protein